MSASVADEDDSTDADTEDAEGHSSNTADEAIYGGFFGAIVYAFRESESRTFRSYVVIGGLLAGFMVALFTQSLIVLLGRTVGVTGGTFTFSRAFIVVVALMVIGPLLAPIISTARRHRYAVATRSTDALVAILGYFIAIILYVALLITAPPELREPVDGSPLEFVEILYTAPPEAVVVPLGIIALTTVGIWLLHRRDRDLED